MKSLRIFFVFFISLILFTLFTLFVSYKIFYVENSKTIGDLNYLRLKSQIETIYTTLKYDLQNIVRDSEYKPVSDLFVYEKNTQLLNFLKGIGVSKESAQDYLKKNIQNIIFLEDGFGYLLPFKAEKKLYFFVALERGDNIYISSFVNPDDYENVDICILPVKEIKGNAECNGEGYRDVAKFKIFTIKFKYNEPLSLKFIILLVVLLIIIGGFFSFWVTRHLSIEENRILNEIRLSIEKVKEGKLYLLTCKSIYPSYNQLIEGINSLIQTMSAEIDKHKIVYNEYFKREETQKSVSESGDTILRIFFENFSRESYLDLLKSFDLLLKKNGGGLRYKGEMRNEQRLFAKLLSFILLEIFSTAKAYQLIIEFSDKDINIVSENIDFEFDKDNSLLFSLNNIEISGRKITIRG